MTASKKLKTNYFLGLIGFLTRWVGFISPALGARIFATVWFKVSRSRPNPNRETWLKACRKFEVPHRGKVLAAYSRIPTSPKGKVVLLHGWSGRWDQLIAIADSLFLADFEVIVFDFPSHGENAGKDTDLFELSEFLKSTFDSLNLISPIIICHSAAFLTVSHAVLKRNLVFSKLIMINSPSQFSYLIDVFREKIGFSKRLDIELWKVIEQRVRANDAQMQLETKGMSTISSDKIFVIHDMDDKEVKFSELAKMKVIWPNSKELVTSALGHNRILSNQLVIDEIGAFCKGG